VGFIGDLEKAKKSSPRLTMSRAFVGEADEEDQVLLDKYFDVFAVFFVKNIHQGAGLTGANEVHQAVYV